MITHLPSDIEMVFCYRALEEQCGREKAAFIFQRLWCDLGYQSREHGKCGVFAAAYVPLFVRSVGVEDVVELLIAAKVVERGDNGDLFCPLFHAYNPHLDASYVPNTSEWEKDWNKTWKQWTEASGRANEFAPKLAWYLKSGDTITETQMNRALMLIHMLDVILHEKARDISELDIGTIHGAVAVVDKHSDVKLNVILRRFMSKCRPRKNPLFPPTTEDALARFEDLIILASPDEGYEAWNKRRDVNTHEEAQDPKGISRELAEQLAAIPT